MGDTRDVRLAPLLVGLLACRAEPATSTVEPAPPPPPPARKEPSEPSWRPPPDQDRDGISDDLDRCPDAPEARNDFEDADGCPDRVGGLGLSDDGRTIVLPVKIEFEVAEAELRDPDVLGPLAEFIADNPQLGKVNVDVHTDNRGSSAFNAKLSTLRAEAIRDELVARGVATDRLVPRGRGDTQPITHAAPRDLRRVEFHIAR